jgi:FlaA1/EpsC-like NDP-sugar epimerase
MLFKKPQSGLMFVGLLYDFLSIVLSWCIAYLLCFNFSNLSGKPFEHGMFLLPLVLGIQVFFYFTYRLHRSLWKFSSLKELSNIIRAIVFADVALTCLFFFIHIQNLAVPRSVFLLYPMFLMAFWMGGRLSIRAFSEKKKISGRVERILIVGAGSAAEQFIRDVSRFKTKRYEPVGILDDEKKLHGRDLHGVAILGELSSLKAALKSLEPDMVVIAMPSVPHRRLREIIELASGFQVPIRTLPSIVDITTGRVAISELREVSIEDVLGRTPVELDSQPIQEEIGGATVFVTGGAGSIGSELCRQIVRLNPKQLIIVDHSEFNLYQIEQELTAMQIQFEFFMHLVNVSDEIAVKDLFERYSPDLVFHAAAYKHVPMLEHQVKQAVKNNVLGTKIIAEAAVKSGVRKFVMVSTDKAVNPTNVMGATKRAAEVFCQNFNLKSETKFITVRFGNVLDSAGSVLPLFKKQIQRGGPVTVTHPDITRYFMTIPEACQLILHSGAIGEGGEIFVLDMGEAIKITDLANQLIQLSGRVPGEDIDIVYSGLRPGEKLYEELFHENEILDKTVVDKIFKSQCRGVSWEKVSSLLSYIQESLPNTSDAETLRVLSEIVPEFKQKDSVAKLDCA